MNREREAPLDVVIALEHDSSANTFFRSASVAFPGPRGRTSGADGLQRGGVLSAPAAEAVRGCSPSAAVGTPHAATATRTTTHLHPTTNPKFPVAVSAHEPSRSARTTSAGASHARTEDAAGRSPAAAVRVLRRGEWAHNPNHLKGHNPNPRRGSGPHNPSRAAVTADIPASFSFPTSAQLPSGAAA